MSPSLALRRDVLCDEFVEAMLAALRAGGHPETADRVEHSGFQLDNGPASSRLNDALRRVGARIRKLPAGFDPVLESDVRRAISDVCDECIYSGAAAQAVNAVYRGDGPSKNPAARE